MEFCTHDECFSTRQCLWKAMVLCRIHAASTHFVNLSPIPLPRLRLLQIHSSDQHGELFRRECHLHFSHSRLRPSESPTSQFLGTNPKSAAIPIDQFQPIVSRIAE